MKIVHVIDNLRTGGAEVLLLSTLKKLPEHEHHVFTLTPLCDLKEVHLYARVQCLHHKGWHSLLRTVGRLRKMVAAVNPDVVHAHLFLSSFITRVALGVRYNLVYSLHNLYRETVFSKPHLRWLEITAFRKEHKLIAVSQYVLDDYKKVVCKCKGGVVLYNFIGDAFFQQQPACYKALANMPKRWVAVGSFKPQKNYRGVISAFAELAGGAERGFSLTIFGDGPQRKEMEELARLLDAPVHFKGNVQDLHQELPLFDAYLSASIYEGYGIAPMEALACGVPLFLSDIPVYREIYGNHAFFFPVSGTGKGDLAKACAAFTNMETADRIAWLESGRQYAFATANSETYKKKLLAIYQQ